MKQTAFKFKNSLDARKEEKNNLAQQKKEAINWLRLLFLKVDFCSKDSKKIHLSILKATTSPPFRILQPKLGVISPLWV